MLLRSKAGVVFLAIAIAAMLTYILIISSGPNLQASLENQPASAAYTVFVEQNGYSVRNPQGIIELRAEREAERVINHALSAVSERGGRVFLATGDYVITASLKVHGSTVLEGEAIDDVNNSGFGTRLIAASNLDGPILTNANPETGDSCILIRNLSFDGSRSNTYQTIGLTGITLTRTTRCRIIDVAVYRCRDSGILFDGNGGTVEAIIERVSSRGNNYAGLNMRTQSDFHITDCEFGSNQGPGILLSSCSSGSVIGCNVFLNKQSGIHLYNTMHMRLMGNRLNHNGKSGIEIIATTQGRGDYNILLGNECYDNGQYSKMAAGIKIAPAEAEISNCVIATNSCFDDQLTRTQDYGILESPGGVKNLFVGNLCRDNGLEDIQLSGSVIEDAASP